MKKILIFFVLIFLADMCFAQQSVKKEKTTIVLWDASLSMVNRDIEKDFSFLANYFKESTEIDLKVIVFSSKIEEEKEFAISNGEWNDLKDYLLNLVYDGSTNFEIIESHFNKRSETLFFTDGLNNCNTSPELLDSNDFYINSMAEGTIEDKIVDENVVSGFVYNDDIPLKNVKVSVKGTNESVVTDSQGNFKIEAKQNDTLLFEYQGYDTISYLIEKNDTILVTFFSKIESLDEVVVKTKGSFEEVVNTATGKRNKNAVGYAVQSITDKDISPAVTNVSQAVQGKFSGAGYGQNQDLSQVVIRGGSNSILSNNYGLIVIDGVPMPRSSSASVGLQDDAPQRTNATGGLNLVQGTSYLDPNNIESVTILKGLAATNRYGSLGNNGVILITTKTAGKNIGTGNKSLKVLNNNIYTDETIKYDKEKKSIPYIKELSKFKTVKKAYTHYLTQRLQYLNSPEYFLNVYDFFKKTNKPIANRILSNVLELFPDNLSALKLLAFKYDFEKDFELANAIYEKILKQNPTYAQSYLDVANAYINIKDHKKSLEQFKRITSGEIVKKIDISGLSKTIDNDFRNLIRKNKNELSIAGIPPKYLHNTEYDARLVLQWNNPGAEFIVQFVNPLKRYITWNHTNSSNSTRIKDELTKGYFIEEFHIDGDIKELKGEWIMNIKDINSTAATPNYYKIEIYTNFGRANQIKKKFLFTPSKSGENENILKFSIN